MKILLFVVLTAVCCPVIDAEDSSLCFVPGCQCIANEHYPDLTDVECGCAEGQSVKLGSSSRHPDAKYGPESTAQLRISGCASVELLSGSLNALSDLRNVSITACENVTVQGNIFESRRSTGRTAAEIDNFEIAEIRQLFVEGHAFEGVRVESEFFLREVFMDRVAPFAFSFDHVGEFSVFGSRLDRVSTWGFKLDSCEALNVLGISRFYSVASRGFDASCRKFMLAYNEFVNLVDSSFEVQYGVADIQGNTFESLTGKPFLTLRPAITREMRNEGQQELPPTGFVFRENKFPAIPTLPFGSLVMPAYNQLTADSDALVTVEDNHFRCDCDKTAWFVGAVVHDFKSAEVEAIGGGSLEFIRELYATSGDCLDCDDLRRCQVNEGKSFKEYAENALSNGGNKLKCSSSGKLLNSYNYEEDRMGEDDRPRLIPARDDHDDDGPSPVRNVDFGGEGDGDADGGGNSAAALNNPCLLTAFVTLVAVIRKT